MSKAYLLNTNTINYQELVGNGRTYKAPPYQRDYSWNEEQWEDLWQDVAELRSDPGTRHYMGAVVAKAESDREFLIIDGQQRLATLSILALAIIDRLENLARSEISANDNLERAKALRARFIGEKDPASLTEISKLVLNERDNGFFQDYLVQLNRPQNPRSLPKSSSLLWNCFAFFQKGIEADAGVKDDGLKLAELLSETIARQLMFIMITVDDEVSAYTVFETLNARGLELTTADLLKNYLFSRLKAKNDLESVQRRWQTLITVVRQERFAEFLRYHYLTRHRQIRSGRLFKLVRSEVSSAKDVLALMGALDSRAELFEALSDPSHSLWADILDAKLWIRELNLFRVRQMTPLLFAAREKMSDADFVRVLKLVATISFRYTIVSSLNPNELEPVYHDAAKAVLDETAATPRQVFELLKQIYVSDQKFRADFAELCVPSHGQRRRLAKYILSRLESDASGGPCDPETDPATIEHILPENPTHEWEEMIPGEHWAGAVSRLGNLALLENALNRQVGNMSYSKKIAAYETSRYALAAGVPPFAPETWSLALIDKRQKHMAERAAHIWRADFDDERTAS